MANDRAARSTGRRRAAGVAVAGLVAVAVVATVAVSWGLPEVERGLRRDTVEALTDAGHYGVRVSFDGRDAQLVVPSGLDGEAVRRVAADVDGVRDVDISVLIEDDVTVPETPTPTDMSPAEPAPDTTLPPPTTVVASSAAPTAGTGARLEPRLTVRLTDGATSLHGRLTASQHDALLLGLTEGAGALDDSVVDRVTVVDGSSDDHADALVGLAGSLARELVGQARTAQIEVDPVGDRVTVDVVAVSEIAADELAERLDSGSLSNDVAEVVGAVSAPSAEDVADELTAQAALAGINFASNSAQISPESTTVLDGVVDVLEANPSLALEIRGHTDSQGPAAANQALSEQRAQAVVLYLLARGIEPARLAAAGFGDTQPIADNSTEAGRQQNRRIEFVEIGA